jgi:predicted RNase H-like HicB family nuclease
VYVSDELHFTIRYTPVEDGWWMAQVEEVPGALSQGETGAQARENVLDALRLMLSDDDAGGDPDREPLPLQLAS